MTEQVKQCAMDTKDVVDLLYSIANQVGVLIGDKGAVSVFRFAGKQMGKKIGEGHAGKSIDEARSLVSDFFRNKEFMEGVCLQDGQAELVGCKIGLTLREQGIPAGNHALCHFGFGLIDGVVESVTGQKIVTLHVQSEYHENGVTCSETW